MTDHEEGFARDDSSQEAERTEIPIQQIQMPRPYEREQFGDERALLRVAVFTRQKVQQQLPLRVENDEAEARQGARRRAAQDRETALGRREVIAVDDSDFVPGQERLEHAAHGVDQGARARGDMPDERAGDVRLDVSHLLVDGRQRGGQRVVNVFERRFERRLHFRDDHGHQVDHRREKEFSLVSSVGFASKQGVEVRRRQRVFEHGTCHHGHRFLGNEAFEEGAEEHTVYRQSCPDTSSRATWERRSSPYVT
jgi:hypothetical protein